MNRRLPAITFAIAAFDLRRRVPDAESLPQHIADIVQEKIVPRGFLHNQVNR